MTTPFDLLSQENNFFLETGRDVVVPKSDYWILQPKSQTLLEQWEKHIFKNICCTCLQRLHGWVSWLSSVQNSGCTLSSISAARYGLSGMSLYLPVEQPYEVFAANIPEKLGTN